MEDVLLIDDDVELCSMLRDYLEKYGFCVSAVHRGDTGLKAALEHGYSLVLLDVMLPGMDGFEILKKIRADSAMNVLMLTARGEDVDRIVGLEIGADDYLPKPFNPRELLARMRAILRRTAAAGTPNERPLLRVDDLELDPAARTVLQNGKSVELTGVEFALLEVLMHSPGKVVAREELAEEVLGRKFSPLDRSLDMHLSRLRKKLAEGGPHEDRVKTIRGVGYQLTIHRNQAEAKD
jgi:two-component system response regulator CpxR